MFPDPSIPTTTHTHTRIHTHAELKQISGTMNDIRGEVGALGDKVDQQGAGLDEVMTHPSFIVS